MSAVVLQGKDHFRRACRHNHFIVDEQAADVECGLCGAKLNPMWVLGELSKKESRTRRTLESLDELVKKTRDKLRCKCEKCGEMTRIDRWTR